MWPLGDWSLRGSLGRRLSEEGHGLARGPWLDNSGKRGQTGCPALGCPRARHQSGPEARIKAGDFAADSTQGLGVKSMISYFSILDQIIFVCVWCFAADLQSKTVVVCRESSRSLCIGRYKPSL